MTNQYIKVPLEVMQDLRDEFSRADSNVYRITTAMIEEDLSFCDFEYNMQRLSSWLDDKEKQMQAMIDDASLNDKEGKIC